MIGKQQHQIGALDQSERCTLVRVAAVGQCRAPKLGGTAGYELALQFFGYGIFGGGSGNDCHGRALPDHGEHALVDSQRAVRAHVLADRNQVTTRLIRSKFGWHVPRRSWPRVTRAA